MKEWYVFRTMFQTHYGFGTRQTAESVLRYLNRNRGPNQYGMDRLGEVFPTCTAAEIENSLDRVDMEADMAGWMG